MGNVKPDERGRGDALPRGVSKGVAVAMGLAMVGLIVAVLLVPATQVRLPLQPGAEWDAELIVEGTARALRKVGVEPVEVVRPNPDGAADGGAVADDPGQSIYQTVYWRTASGGESAAGEAGTWKVTVKRLEDEFIAWPERVD